jgi:hypothetical protein
MNSTLMVHHQRQFIINMDHFGYFANKVKLIILPSINIISFLLNFISILVILKVLKDKRRANEPLSSSIMYKYLLLKGICDTISSLNQIFILLLHNNEKTLVYSIWSLYFNLYFTKSFYLASGFFEIAASFNCAISIENKLKWLQTKISFYITTIGLFTFCFIFQSFYFVCKRIEKYQYSSNGTVIIHYIFVEHNEYFYIEEPLELYTSILRDIVCLLILIILNAYILIKMIQIRKRRTHLQSNIQSINRSRQAVRRKTKMILLLFILYTFGHLPYTIVHLNLLSYVDKEYALYYAEIFLAISFSASFFIYFFFDRKFNLALLKIFKYRPRIQ